MAYFKITNFWFRLGLSYMTIFISLPGAKAIYVANFKGPTDEGWYLDSSATHHLTNSMANLNVTKELRGSDKLIIDW